MCLDITDVMLIWASCADPKLIILSFRSFFFFFQKLSLRCFFGKSMQEKVGLLVKKQQAWLTVPQQITKANKAAGTGRSEKFL